MTRTTLRDQVREHYESKRLEDAKLAPLMDLVRASGIGASSARARRIRFGWTLVAAAGLAVASASAWLFGALPRGDAPTLMAVAHEIAANHVKQLPSEVPATRFAEVSEGLPRLDFPVRAPGGIGALAVTGARYCSVQGRIAAQIQCVDSDGRRATLYQVRDRAEFGGVQEATVTIDGVDVRIWREGDLLLGLAGPPP